MIWTERNRGMMMELFGLPLETIYFYGLALGAALTLFYVLFSDLQDGIFEALPINPALIFAFLSIFSASGYLFEKSSNFHHATGAIISFFIALIVTILLNVFVFIPLASAEESLAYHEEDLKGRIGRVILTIPADGYGEVILEGASGTIAKPAKCYKDETILDGTEVIVVESKEGVLYVAPYEKMLLPLNGR